MDQELFEDLLAARNHAIAENIALNQIVNRLNAEKDELRAAAVRLLEMLRDEDSDWMGPWEDLEEFDDIFDPRQTVVDKAIADKKELKAELAARIESYEPKT